MGTVSNIVKQLKIERDRVQKQASEALQSTAVPLTKIVPRDPASSALNDIMAERDR
jgi:hypothetical protein